ncbi:MAG: hypothetical protein HY718_11415 [Planctomycetes bacterium]|nr:hypothetical protein [Planctomycetota bacterium]
MAAGWIAAGSTGLIGHGLRHAFTWVALTVAIVAGWPGRLFSVRTLFTAVAIGVALAMNSSMQPVVNVMGVAFVLALLAVGRPEPERQIVVLTAAAVAVFGVYRLGVTSAPWLWLAMDSVGEAIGRGGGWIAGRPLAVGATFAGLDFLILVAAVYAGWLLITPGPRLARAGYAAVAIAAAHLVYLVVLAHAPAIVEALGTPEDTAEWSWTAALRTLVPWNLPALAGLLHLVVAGTMFRWSGILDAAAPATPVLGGGHPCPPSSAPVKLRRATATFAAFILAVALPTLTALHAHQPSLAGKKVVTYKEGFLNWLKPEHGEYGRLSVGMYGMLGTYVESLGGKLLVSPDLSEPDLRGADVLILLYPNKPWTAGQLDRIRDFVQGGGSLLMMGEHTVHEKETEEEEDEFGAAGAAPATQGRGDAETRRHGEENHRPRESAGRGKVLRESRASGGSRFNEAIQSTAMRVRFDSAMFEVGGWLQTYEALAHPTTVGMADDRNQFGVVIGASVDARRPARPVLVGRYGWADPGDEGGDAALMGNHRYDAGERLGDLVLVAEQPVGEGKVVVFGDTSSMTNGINVGAHRFTSRLLAYLAGDTATATPAWRQVLGLLAAIGLVLLIGGKHLSSLRVVLVSAGLAVSLLVCTGASSRAATVHPDGGRQSPSNLAYIDVSHLPAGSEESWREDGLGGLTLTLMRNGFLAMNMDTFDAEALRPAGLLIIVAPSREYSQAERRTILDFVQNGGIVICTVGYERSAAARSLLWDLGFYVGLPPGSLPGTPDPEPMGHFKSPFIKVDDYMAHVRFHAAWPVGSTDTDARVIAYGPGDVPVILMRRIDRGKAVIVGDTCFAMNKNLEHEGGEPFEGLRENADFWRWFIAHLTDRPRWLPTDPTTRPADK